MAHAAPRPLANAGSGHPLRSRNDENAATPSNASAYITASMLRSGGLSPLPTSEQLYDIQLPDISSLSPLKARPSQAHSRQALAPIAGNRRAATPSESSLKRRPRASQPRDDTEISVVIPYKPDRSSRSRSHSLSAWSSTSKTRNAIEAEGGLLTPPASGMSHPSPSQIDQTDSHMPHPTSPTPLQPRSRTQSPQKRSAFAVTSHDFTLTPGALTSTPVRSKTITTGTHNKRYRDLVETPVIARIRGQSAAPDGGPVAKSSPNPRARKNTKTSQGAQGPGASSSSDSKMDSDAPLAESSRLEARPISSSALANVKRLSASSGRASKAAGKGKGRVVSGAAYKDRGAPSDDEDEDDDNEDVQIVQITRRNGPEASFLREAREKGWDRITNSPVRTIYLQQEALSQRQRQGSARAKSKTPKPDTENEAVPTPGNRGRSRSTSRSLAHPVADNSAANLSNQSIKSSSSQSSTSTISRKKEAGPARRRASSSAVSTSALRIKITTSRRSRRISAPPANVTIGEITSELPAMPDSPSEDPLLLVGPDPDFPTTTRYSNTSMSMSRTKSGSPSVTANSIRAPHRTAPNNDATFAIPEEDEEDDGGYNGYEPLVFEDASRTSPSKGSRGKFGRLGRNAQMLTSTPLPGARKAAQLPSDIPLPSSMPATPAGGVQDLEVDNVLDGIVTPAWPSEQRAATPPGEGVGSLGATEGDLSAELREGPSADSTAEISHELTSLVQEREPEPAHVVFGQYGDDDGGSSSSDDESIVDDVAGANAGDAAEDSLADAALAAVDSVDTTNCQATDDSVENSVDEARKGVTADMLTLPRDYVDESLEESNEHGAGSDSEMELVGQAYNRDQDAQIHASTGERTGDDEEEGEDEDEEDEEEEEKDEESEDEGSGRQRSDGNGQGENSGSQSSEADSSRIDDEDDAYDENARRLESEEVEILAGSSTRDRTPELPLDDDDGQGRDVSPSSSDGFEILDIIPARPSDAARTKERAASQSGDRDQTLPIHTLQLVHQDDVQAAVNASRSLASRSFAANNSISVDASSASAYSRFVRLAQQTTTPIVEISSLDPHAAARATAILKLHHQYVDEGWIHGDEAGNVSRDVAEAGARIQQGNLPEDMDPQERAKVQQVVRILQEAERIAAGQRGERAVDRSMASTSRFEAGSLTLPQILMDAEINIARQDAHTESSSDDGFSVAGLLAPSEADSGLRTPLSSSKQAAAAIASPATPFLPGGFRREPTSVGRQAEPPAATGSQEGVAQDAASEPTVWSRSDWVRLDRFFAAHVKASAKKILKTELSRNGLDDISQTQIMDVDKVVLQIQALTSIDAYELADGFLDQSGVELDSRRAEWASAKIRFRIPALQRKYLRKLDSKHPGRVTAEHVSLLDRSTGGDQSGNASFSAFGGGHDSIATEDLDWSLTGMTTRIHAGRDGHGDGDRTSAVVGLRPKEGRRAGRVSFGTPYRLGTHSTPMPALKRVQEQAKQDGLYPSLPKQQPSKRPATLGRGDEGAEEQAREGDHASISALAQMHTPAKSSVDVAQTTSTPSVVARTTRLLSRMSGSFFGLGASPASSADLAASKSQDKSASAAATAAGNTSTSRSFNASRGSTAASSSSTRIPTLKKAKTRQQTPIRDFGGRTVGQEGAPSTDQQTSAGSKDMQTASSSTLHVSAERPQGDRETATNVPSKPSRASSPPVAPKLNRKPSISAADLQATSRSIREKRASSFRGSRPGDFVAPHANASLGSSSSSSSRVGLGRVIDTRPAAVPTTATSTAHSTTGGGGRSAITIRSCNSGFSGLTRPTALSLLPNSEASHEMAREKVRQLAKSRTDRGWKSPRATTMAARSVGRRLRPDAEKRVQTAIATEMRKRSAGFGTK